MPRTSVILDWGRFGNVKFFHFHSLLLVQSTIPSSNPLQQPPKWLLCFSLLIHFNSNPSHLSLSTAIHLPKAHPQFSVWFRGKSKYLLWPAKLFLISPGLPPHLSPFASSIPASSHAVLVYVSQLSSPAAWPSCTLSRTCSAPAFCHILQGRFLFNPQAFTLIVLSFRILLLSCLALVKCLIRSSLVG